MEIFNSSDVVIFAPGASGTIGEAIRILEMRYYFESNDNRLLIFFKYNGLYDSAIEYFKAYQLEHLFQVIENIEELEVLLKN